MYIHTQCDDVVIFNLCIGAGISSWFGFGFNRTGPVKFYNREDPYYEFTNFYEVSVKIDDRDWLTTEHYFQAQKFVGTPLVETIRILSRPREAFDKSRDPRYSHWRRNDWESVKEDVMYKALQAKFSQHEKLRRLLLGTGDRELIEHSPHDSYWGDGGNGTGKNRLGVLLVRLRDEMKAKRVVCPPTPPSPMYPKKYLQPEDSSSSDSSSSPYQTIERDRQRAGQASNTDSSSRREPPPPLPNNPLPKSQHDPKPVIQASNATIFTNTGAGMPPGTFTKQELAAAFTPGNSGVAPTSTPAAAASQMAQSGTNHAIINPSSSFVGSQPAGNLFPPQGQPVSKSSLAPGSTADSAIQQPMQYSQSVKQRANQWGSQGQTDHTSHLLRTPLHGATSSPPPKPFTQMPANTIQSGYPPQQTYPPAPYPKLPNSTVVLAQPQPNQIFGQSQFPSSGPQQGQPSHERRYEDMDTTT